MIVAPAWPEIVGYLAASLLLLTFFMRQMVPLRAVALLGSVAWLIYGWADHVYPVIALHSILLPLNAVRLAQALCDQRLATAANFGKGGSQPAAP